MNSAIIGLGVIGKVHYDTLKKQGENVVAICDIDSGKLANFSADRKYDDYKKMLDDGVSTSFTSARRIICTPKWSFMR